MEETGKNKVSLKPAVEKDTAMPMSVSLRAYFSSYHLWAARAFCASAEAIEAAHTGPASFDISHRAFVINAILSSAAFAEAAINEIYQDAADGHASYTKDLDEAAVAILADYWNMTEVKGKSHVSTLDKYQLALRFLGHEPLDASTQPYQDANLVMKLRNTLVHYKPESISPGEKHRLSQQLQGKFDSNRLFEGSGNPFFPDHCLGFGCATWAITSVTGLADEFFARIDIQPHYKTADFGTPQLCIG